MNCPKCGYAKAKYNVSRKVLWGGHRQGESSLTRKTDVRTDYSAHCPKCGHKWDAKPEDFHLPLPGMLSDQEGVEVEDQEELEESEADLEDEES